MPDWFETMNSLKPASPKPFQGRRRARKNFHFFGPAQIILFRNDCPVAVEKYSPVHSGKLWFDYGKNGIEFFRGVALAHLDPPFI